MGLISCPECGRQISDKAATCPGCGLPASYFVLDTAASNSLQLADALPINENYITGGNEKNKHEALPVSSIHNALITFEQDYRMLFSPNDYIDSKKATLFRHSYQSVLKAVPDSLNRQLVESFIMENDIDDYHLNQFQAKMSLLDDETRIQRLLRSYPGED